MPFLSPVACNVAAAPTETRLRDMSRGAVSAGNPALEPVHVLDALLKQPDGIALADPAAEMPACALALGAIVVFAGWYAVRPSLNGLDMMPLTEPTASAKVIGGVLLNLLIYVAGAMFVIAVLDGLAGG